MTDIVFDVVDDGEGLIVDVLADAPVDVELPPQVFDVVTVDSPGPAGLSAYQVAVKAGYTGTVEEWFETLKGEPGAQGPQGEAGTKYFTGHGPPNVVIGARLGDIYRDIDTGIEYRLD